MVTARPLSDRYFAGVNGRYRLVICVGSRRIYVPWRRPRSAVPRWEAIKRAIIADDELSAEYDRIDCELREKGL